MDRSPNQGIYVAVNGAVYYRNNTMNNWTLFTNGLPNVRIDDMDLFYGSSAGENRVRVGTFGRGMWESSLFDDSENGPVGVGICIIIQHPCPMRRASSLDLVPGSRIYLTIKTGYADLVQLLPLTQALTVL